MVKKKEIDKEINIDDNPSGHENLLRGKNLQTGKTKKSIADNEERQLRWFFIIVGIVFAVILISYFSNESSKSFEYSGITWKIEDYKDLKIYHGIFSALTIANLDYNIFLRIDPRKNDIETVGTFNDFKYGGIISLSPDIDRCRGELSRVIFDLGAFLRQGVGVGPLVSASTDRFTANETNRTFVQCDTISDRTIVVLEFGNSSVIQNLKNPSCYVIKVKDCNDISSVERFMVKTVKDFNKEN